MSPDAEKDIRWVKRRFLFSGIAGALILLMAMTYACLENDLKSALTIGLIGLVIAGLGVVLYVVNIIVACIVHPEPRTVSDEEFTAARDKLYGKGKRRG